MRGAMRDRQRVEDRLTGSHALGEFVGVPADWRVGDGIRAQLLGKRKRASFHALYYGGQFRLDVLPTKY